MAEAVAKVGTSTWARTGVEDAVTGYLRFRDVEGRLNWTITNLPLMPPALSCSNSTASLTHFWHVSRAGPSEDFGFRAKSPSKVPMSAGAWKPRQPMQQGAQVVQSKEKDSWVASTRMSRGKKYDQFLMLLHGTVALDAPGASVVCHLNDQGFLVIPTSCLR